MGFFGILVCFKQFLGNWEVFCYVVDYPIGFSKPYLYCRVSSSCDTIAEMKEGKQVCLILFFYLCCLLWMTEYFISVFYSWFFFLFFIPVFKHSGLSLKEEEYSHTQSL